MLGLCRPAPARDEADDFALEDGDAVARRFALDGLEDTEHRRLLVVREVDRHLHDPAILQTPPPSPSHNRKPPLLNRIAAAIFLATSRRSVARLML